VAASDLIVISLPKDRIREASRQIVTARFRDRATAADVTPTNVQWRLDDPDTGCEIAGWTSETPGTSVSITTTPTHNTCKGCRPIERRQLTVAADYGLATQFVESAVYEIRNIGAISL
jgi:hypothetical protein